MTTIAEFIANTIYPPQETSMSFHLNGRTIVVTFKMLTPEEAEIMLVTLNTRNRRLNSKASDLIAEDIVCGDWKFTGDTIKIAVDDDGIRFLADAQHRLDGIVKGGVAVPVLIVENLDPSATSLLDQVRNRAVGDILRMTYERSEMHNDTIIAGIANILMSGYGIAGKPTRRQVADYVNGNFDKIATWASWALAMTRETDKVQCGQSLTSAMAPSPLGSLAIHMVESGGNHDLVQEFFWRIASGIVPESDRTNVIPAMRKRQKNGLPLARVAGGSNVTTLFTEFAVYISYYNKWIAGEKVSVAKAPKKQIRSFSELPPVSHSSIANYAIKETHQ